MPEVATAHRGATIVAGGRQRISIASRWPGTCVRVEAKTYTEVVMHVPMLSTGLVIALALAGSNVLIQGAQGTASPDLVAALAKNLGSTPQQAEGAAGALFGLAKSRLKPADWSKVAGSVPGMDGLLNAAPAVSTGTTGTKGFGVPPLPGAAAVGGLSSVAAAFTKLGLTPDMAVKAVPVLTSFVTKAGGPAVGQLLAGALK